MGTANRLGELCGRTAAWAFVGVGAVLAYEVVMRYVFGAPTIWAEEVARMIQIWASYLAAGMLLAQRRMIRVSAVTNRRLGQNVGPRAFHCCGSPAFA